jgi:hypothetical protein
MVYAKVVSNTHGPWQKFAFFCVPATADGVNNFDENVLKNILGKIFVFNEEQDRSVQFVLVAKY